MSDVITTSRGLQVRTLIHAGDAMLKRLDKQVFLYDPSWIATSDKDDIDTLPFAYLEVIKEDVVQNVAVSKKRLILFQPQDDAQPNTPKYRRSAINIVADNVVNDPVIHRLDCLIPANAVSNLIDRTAGMASSILGGAAERYEDNAWQWIRLVISAVAGTTRLATQLADYLKPFINFNSDFNRRSLLSMARRRAILEYKPWDSWDRRNVVITGLQIHKVGTEDNYFRGTVELQEMPILYVSNSKMLAGKAASRMDGFSIGLSTAIKKVFEATINKMGRR